jgi:hypothetical protein
LRTVLTSTICLTRPAKVKAACQSMSVRHTAHQSTHLHSHDDLKAVRRQPIRTADAHVSMQEATRTRCCGGCHAHSCALPRPRKHATNMLCTPSKHGRSPLGKKRQNVEQASRCEPQRQAGRTLVEPSSSTRRARLAGRRARCQSGQAEGRILSGGPRSQGDLQVGRSAQC